MVRGSGGKAMGNDRSNCGLLACTYADRISLEIGEPLGRKFRGHKLGLVCGLSLRNSGYKRLQF